jgi:hypothetical protein
MLSLVQLKTGRLWGAGSAAGGFGGSEARAGVAGAGVVGSSSGKPAPYRHKIIFLP